MTRYVVPGETDAYRRSRQELFAAEIALRDQIERVAQLRRALPLGLAMPDYVFRTGPDDLERDDPDEFTDVHLSDLFADGHDTLVVDHLMFGRGTSSPASSAACGPMGTMPSLRTSANEPISSSSPGPRSVHCAHGFAIEAGTASGSCPDTTRPSTETWRWKMPRERKAPGLAC